MFTGLVETTGRVIQIQPQGMGVRLVIGCGLRDYVMGESIAVNGICLTVVEFREGQFGVDASSETLSRTNLGALRPGSSVHLERALRVGDRLGGHWVLGHVDGTGRVVRVVPSGSSRAVTIEASAGILKYIVEKGSVALDGASLTVNRVSAGSFEIMLIPHTQSVLSGDFLSVGHVVNIEVDILGKYVEKLLACHGVKQSDIEPQTSSLTLDRLREAGFC